MLCIVRTLEVCGFNLFCCGQFKFFNSADVAVDPQERVRATNASVIMVSKVLHGLGAEVFITLSETSKYAFQLCVSASVPGALNV